MNDPLIVFGPRKADAMLTRSDALVALGKFVDPKAKDRAEVESQSLEVVSGPGGRSAWAFDAFTAGGQGMVAVMLLRNDDDLWTVTTASIAITPQMREIRAQLKKVAVVPPGATAVERVDSRASGAVAQFRKGLLDQAVWGEDLSNADDAVLIGPSAGDVVRGKKELKKLWKQRVDANTRAAISGEVSAAITPDGQLAWVTAPVTRVENDEDPIPLRVFAVFEKDGDKWKMIALHESVAIDEPGSGAKFVKDRCRRLHHPSRRPWSKSPMARRPRRRRKRRRRKRKSRRTSRSSTRNDVVWVTRSGRGPRVGGDRGGLQGFLDGANQRATDRNAARAERGV